MNSSLICKRGMECVKLVEGGMYMCHFKIVPIVLSALLCQQKTTHGRTQLFCSACGVRVNPCICTIFIRDMCASSNQEVHNEISLHGNISR